MAFGTSLPARIAEATGAVTNVSTLAALNTALAGVANGSIINITANINGGGATLTISRNAAAGATIMVTCDPGVTITNLFIYVKGSYLRFRTLDISLSPIDGIKFTDGANHCEVDHCHVHHNTRMGINVQNGSSAPSDIQIWNNEINNNGSTSNLDHGIYFAIVRGSCVVANNLVYANWAYNFQFYPDDPNLIVTCNTMDDVGQVGSNARGGMVIGSETGLTDNVIVVGTIGTNAAYYCIDVYDPAAGDSGNNAYDCLGFGNTLGDFGAGGGFTYTNCSHADPLYVNRAARDYHLQAGSPAIDKVQAARYGYVPVLDRDGLARITADAGCYRATTPAPVNTVAPVVSGTPRVGLTLSTTDGTWTGAPAFTYQWQRDNSGHLNVWTNIGGAAVNTYTLVDADDGCNIRCVVTGTNAGGVVSASSNYVGQVVEPVPGNTVAPLMTGTPIVGQLLSCTSGTWTNLGGAAGFSYAYQWQRDVLSNGVYSNIVGATVATHVVSDADDGCRVRCVVTTTNTGGFVQATSNATATVFEPLPSNTATPVVTAPRLQSGDTITCSAGTWSAMGGIVATYDFLWFKDNHGNGVFASIGSVGTAYVLTDLDIGSYLRCTVTATNDTGAVAVVSNSVGAVVAGAGTPISTSPSFGSRTLAYVARKHRRRWPPSQ